MPGLLREHLSYDQAQAVLESVEEGDKKSLYLKGICIQGDIQNENKRVYPREEITRAVKTLGEQIKSGYSVLGELDHPPDLKINLERVTHMMTACWMDGANGYGKLKILPTPMGEIVKAMLLSGVKLGVSSRGSGDVNDSNGKVSNFEILTVDIVAQPSAPNAYPTPIYENLMNMKGGYKTLEVAAEAAYNPRVQKYLSREIVNLIRDLKL
jgi:hypothetical protein